MDLNILRLMYFLILKRRALALFILMERSLTWCCQVSFVSILTPRYLTLSVGYSFLPYNLIFKSTAVYFAWFKDYHFSFFTLNEILFDFNQLTRSLKSALTSLLSLLIELLRDNRLVPQVKWWTLQNFIAWSRSFIYNKNRRGSNL